MRLRSLSGFLWLALTTTALVVAGGALLSYYAERGSFEAPYSTYRADRRGTKAFFLLLERLGYTPLRVTEEFSVLREQGLLFIIAPLSGTGFLSDVETDSLEENALDDWVKQGNTAVVVCGGKQNLFVTELHQQLKTEKANRRTRSRPVRRLPLTASVKTLVMNSGAYFQPRRARAKSQKWKWSPLFETATGRPQVLMARRGQGTCILVADGYPLSNVGMTEGDNLTFLLNLVRLYAREGVVLFDEFHHGHAASRGVIAYMKQRSLHYFLLYLLAAVGVGLWRSGTRFGQVIPRWSDPRRESVEYAYAVATLYQSARMRRYALETCFTHFQKQLARFVHHSGAWDAERVAARFERKTQHHPREVVEISQAVEQALQSETLTDAEVLQLCRRMAEFEERFWVLGSGL